MSATPIPRTLNMSLIGIRDMSIIETPPKDRLSIQTNVVKFDPQVIGTAIRTELARGGQVYFVHNRVESIFFHRRSGAAAGAGGQGGRGARADGRGSAGASDVRLRREEVRRPARHHHRRERPRHPEREHDHHQSGRSLRPVAALSAARARRALRSRRLCLSPDPAGRQSVADRQETARGDQGVQRSRQRLSGRRARPRNSRRRQPARRRAERTDRHRRLRAVHEAPGADRPRAEGRGDRRRRPARP